MQPSQLIYPSRKSSGDSGICAACGESGLGVSAKNWIRDTFTDRDKLYPGEIICHACLFCFAEISEELATKVGKEKPQKMRNYSHFVANGEWLPLSKGDKAKMKDLLLNHSPEVAIIAESGQKHIIFRAQIGYWQFEEQSMPADAEGLRALLEIVEAIYSAGASKKEIESGNYSGKAISSIGIARWRELETQLKPKRGGLLLRLACFLAQKSEEEPTDDTRTDCGQPANAPVERNQQRVQEQIQLFDLAAI